MWFPMAFDNKTLTFETYLPDEKDPETYLMTKGSVDQSIVATGDLQPFLPKGKEQVSLVDGFTLNNAKCFITDADIPTMEDVGGTQPAQTVYKGRTYFVMRDMDYSDGGMATDGHFYVLMMKNTVEGSV